MSSGKTTGIIMVEINGSITKYMYCRFTSSIYINVIKSTGNATVWAMSDGVAKALFDDVDTSWTAKISTLSDVQNIVSSTTVTDKAGLTRLWLVSPPSFVDSNSKWTLQTESYTSFITSIFSALQRVDAVKTDQSHKNVCTAIAKCFQHLKKFITLIKGDKHMVVSASTGKDQNLLTAMKKEIRSFVSTLFYHMMHSDAPSVVKLDNWPATVQEKTAATEQIQEKATVTAKDIVSLLKKRDLGSLQEKINAKTTLNDKVEKLIKTETEAVTDATKKTAFIDYGITSVRTWIEKFWKKELKNFNTRGIKTTSSIVKTNYAASGFVEILEHISEAAAKLSLIHI